jgi:hypothetical protein
MLFPDEPHLLMKAANIPHRQAARDSTEARERCRGRLLCVCGLGQRYGCEEGLGCSEENTHGRECLGCKGLIWVHHCLRHAAMGNASHA